MRAEFELFAPINQFSRFAFVSDKEWPQAVGHFLALLIPTVEMKVFTPDRSEDAVKWAAEPPAKKPETPASMSSPSRSMA